MKTFTATTTFHSVTSEGVSIGPWHLTREQAQAAADALTREWKGQRTYGVVSFDAETFTTHER